MIPENVELTHQIICVSGKSLGEGTLALLSEEGLEVPGEGVFHAQTLGQKQTVLFVRAEALIAQNPPRQLRTIREN